MKNQVVCLFLATLLSVSWVTSSSAQEIEPATVAKPVIQYFNVAPAGILHNQVAILTMSVSGATSIAVTFSPCASAPCYLGDGRATATFLLNPTETTTYTVTAKNSGGTVVARQKVVVGEYINKPTPVPPGLKVTWGEACWFELDGKEYQAIPLNSEIPTPPGALPIEATLYYDSTTCDGEDGGDNLNDYQTVVHSGGFIFWFTRHPDAKVSSAIWTFGNQSSGCVSYEEAPVCDY